MEKYEANWNDTYIIRDPRFAGTFWKLDKRMKVNLKLYEVNNRTRKINVHPSLVDVYDPTDPTPVSVASQDMIFNPGQPVRWSRRRKEIFIVCRQSKESVTIAKFGGEPGGQVYRTHPGTLTKVKGRVGGTE